MSKNYDFSGWATKNDLRCSDGRIIRRDAFKGNDGHTVPLVWNHMHNDPENVLGHALLKNREDGVYAYCSFNETSAGKQAKAIVEHGDVCSLSIWANELRQNGSEVLHGAIKEVSLVLAGANPGAFIDNVLSHGDLDEEEAIIFTGEDIYLSHADKDDEEEEDEPEEKKEEEKEDMANEQQSQGSGKTIKEIFDSMTKEQQDACYALIGMALEENEGEDNEDEDDGGNEEVKHNVFDNETDSRNYLSHSDMQKIFSDAKRTGSLKAAIEDNLESGFLAHATDSHGNTITYGIADIDYLFPDAKAINNTPEFIQRDNGWVANVINGTHHTPFSRVKSIFADITEDEARAKGYIKGKQKKEEVFTLLKRTTDPQTIYKKQKLDRDDILDITDFDVVAWVKGEMRMMLEEEIARAILIGDGRESDSDDKIQEAHVRPVYNDADLYTVKVPVEVASGADGADKAKALMDAAIRARKNYKGSGTPTFYTTEDWLTEMLLLEDGINHKLYKSEAEVATALRVKEIVTVEPMEGQQIGITVNNVTTKYDFIGVIVNLADYNVGADKGGETSFFDDFDIDYNQQKYLYETRMSGALIKPYSALSFYVKETA